LTKWTALVELGRLEIIGFANNFCEDYLHEALGLVLLRTQKPFGPSCGALRCLKAPHHVDWV